MVCLPFVCSCSESVNPDRDWCNWHYLGRGTQYQVLAGPMFIVLFAISGIPLGRFLFAFRYIELLHTSIPLARSRSV